VLVFILIKRLIHFFHAKQEQKRKKKLTQIISSCFLKKQSCELIKKVHTKTLLLEVLEIFNHRFNGDEWEVLKNDLSSKFLLPQARRWTHKLSWMKRNFSARVFALSPLKEDESLINALIDDESFLVSSIASYAALKLESPIGIRKSLLKIAKKEGYNHYFYADILSQGSNTVFQLISQICQKRDHLHLTCLEVLAMQTAQAPLKFLAKDLKSKDPELKQAALKVAIRNPQEEWLDIFCLNLSDENEEIRRLAAIGLKNYPSSKSLKALKRGLHDESWQVQLASAISLKVLNHLDLIEDKELKKYVQEFA